MKLEQAHIAFLEQSIHTKVEVNIRPYLNSAIAKNNIDINAVPGFLKGINKNKTQQFDIDFDLSDVGFEYLNCFNENCRLWSHTAHAENITILKRSVSQLTDEENIIIGERMQIYPEDVIDWINGDCGHDDFENLNTWLPCYDILKAFGILLPFTYLNETNTPVTLQPHEIIEMGWVKLLTD